MSLRRFAANPFRILAAAWPKWILAALALGLFLAFLHGERQRPPRDKQPDTKSDSVPGRNVADLPRAGQSDTVRTILKYPAGPCVVRLYPRSMISTAPFSQFRRSDFGEMLFEPGNPWYVGQDRGQCDTSFNCCAFAVGDLVGLNPGQWVGTEPTPDGYPTPIAVILDSYFAPVCSYSIDEALTTEGFARDNRVRDDDVLCFELPLDSQDPLRRRFTHVGRVRRLEGVNRLVSKFGEGPVAVSDLQFPNRMFPGAERIVVYRFQPSKRSALPSSD